MTAPTDQTPTRIDRRARAAARPRLRVAARPIPVTVSTAAVAVIGILLTAAPATLAGQLMAVCLVVACLGIAERAAGGFRAVLLLVGPALVAAPASALLAMAQATIPATGVWTFARTSALDPVSIGMGLVMGASAFLPPLWRRRIRTVLLLICGILVLYDGEPIQVTRLIAALAGLTLGVAGGPRIRVAAPPLTRSIVVAALAACGAGPLIVQMSASAEGVLAPLGGVDDGPLTTIVIPVALLAAALLIRRGRVAALPVAGIALSILIVIAVEDNLVQPLRDGWIEWTGLTVSRAEWQLGLIGSWVLPLTALILILVDERRRRLLGPTPAEAGVRDRELMAQRVGAADAGSLGHMTTWPGNRYWYGRRATGAIAFRLVGRVALAVSDPIATRRDAPEVIAEFAEHCDRQGLIPVFYGVHDHHLATFQAMGWHTVAAAEEALIELGGFSLRGRQRQDLRTALNRAARTGITARWDRYIDLPENVQHQIRQLFDQWVGGKKLPEMGFTLGRLPQMEDPSVQVLVAIDHDDVVHAVTSWLPVWDEGRPVGYTLDVMRRRPDAMPGAMEFLIASAALRLQADGLSYLSLSGSPLSAAPATTRWGRLLERVVRAVTAPVRRAYGFESLAHFKRKFQTGSRSLHIAFADALTAPGVCIAIVRAYFPGVRLRDLRPGRR